MSEPDDRPGNRSTAAPATTDRIRSRRLPTVLLTVAAAGGLAAGGYGIASAASPTPSPSSSSPSSSGPSSASPTASPSTDRPDRAMWGGRGSQGRVTAVGTSSITVTSDSGTTTVYRTDAATTVHQGRDRTVALSTVRIGDLVHVSAPAASGSTAATATDIDVRLPRLDGTVTSVGSGTITIRDRQGFTRTIVTSTSTAYAKDGTAATSAAVTTGVRLASQGRVDTNGTSLDATRVDVLTRAPAGGPMGGGAMGDPMGGGRMGDRMGGHGRGPMGGERPDGTSGTGAPSPTTPASPSASTRS